MQITDDIILMAYHGEPMPDLLTGAETLCYMALAAIYADFRRGELDKAAATRLKHQIMCAYEMAKFDMKLNEHYIAIIKATSLLACDVRKNPDAMSLPCVANLISALDGVAPMGGNT
jgi:hypothetical protein